MQAELPQPLSWGAILVNDGASHVVECLAGRKEDGSIQRDYEVGKVGSKVVGCME